MHNLDIDANFTQDFYDSSVKVIKYEDFNNLSFYYKVIELYNETLAKSFKGQVEDYIIKTIENSKRKIDFDDLYPFGVENYDIFKDFVKEQIKNHALKIDFKDFFLNPDNQRNNDDVKKAVNEITKDDLHDVIWADLGDCFRSRRRLLESIVQHSLFSKQKSEEVRQWIRELLNENVKENPDNEIAVTLLLQNTENLTKFT